jgi:hypothetical protein
MPDEPIDKNCTITLPASDSTVFVQLRESRPESLEYEIDLKSPDGTVTNVAPRKFREIPVPHSLGRSARNLHGYAIACVGAVYFKVAGDWKLKLETVIDGVVVHTCGPETINASQSGISTFSFICEYQ